MKYETTEINYGIESVINENEYSINITIGLHPTDLIAPDFSKDIQVISKNSMTGFEVDNQRQKAIDDFMLSIN